MTPDMPKLAALAALAPSGNDPVDPAALAWRLRCVEESTKPVPRQVARFYAMSSMSKDELRAALAALLLAGVTVTETVLADGPTRIILSWPNGYATLVCYNKGREKPEWAPKPLGPRLHAGSQVMMEYFCEPDAAAFTLLHFFARMPKTRSHRRVAVARTIGLIEVNGRGVFAIDEHAMPRQAFVRDNYEDHVMNQFDALKAFCRRRTPSEEGALVLLDGPPGTGKTHIIRGLVNSVAAPFVLAAGSTIANLENPGFIPFILRECRERGGLVLILEDADSILVSREFQQNVSLLSLLLNATSGILGDIGNLRVVATVNTWDEDRVDSAVLRPGRLYSRIRVGDLPEEHARRVVLRVSGGNELATQRVTGPLSLAECYALGRGAQT